MPNCPANSARPVGAPHCAQCVFFPAAFYGGTNLARAAEIEGRRLESRDIPAKRIIYRAGEIAREMQILYRGWAFRYKLLTGGRRQILSFALPGDAISMRMLFLDRGSFSVQALTNCTLCTFDRADFADYIAIHAETARRAELLCAETNAASEEQLADIGRRTAYERVGRLILQLARRMEQKGMLQSRDGQQGWTGQLPLSQMHIADALGLTAIHVGRVLRQLHGDRVLTLNRAHFQIHDLPALERL